MCYFSLSGRAKAMGVNKEWHRAFHGTRHEFIESILKVGELAVPGQCCYRKQSVLHKIVYLA